MTSIRGGLVAVVGSWRTNALRALFLVGLVAACDPVESEDEKTARHDEGLSTCRSFALEATKFYRPTRWEDFYEVTPSLHFALASEIAVTEGSAGKGHATLVRTVSGTIIECIYRGRALPGQIEPSLKYTFEKCDDGAQPGDIVETDSLRLHLQNADHKFGTTRVSLQIDEVEPCGGTGGAGGGTSAGGAGGVSGNGGAGGAQSTASTTGAGVTTVTTAATTGAGASGGGGAAQSSSAVSGAGGAETAATTGAGGEAGGAGGAQTSSSASTGVGGGGTGGGPVACTASNVDDLDPATTDRCDPDTGEALHTRANDLDPGVASTMKNALSYLYFGQPPVLSGADPSAIDVVRAAGLMGDIVLEDGSPAMNIPVRVLDHPEYGTTLTSAQGRYLFLVNAGAPLTVDIVAPGFLPAQRTVDVVSQTYATADPLMLVAYDPSATIVDLAAMASVETAEGSVITDDNGTRQGALMITPGTVAAMLMPDGSTQPLPTMTLRITEFTAGADGPLRMPAPLPASSAYTYAIEISADEAVAAGAEHVTLSQPVSYFLENYYGAPTGVDVPVGAYDHTEGHWIPDPDGRVVEIIGDAGGVAELDADGDFLADDDATLEAMGISIEERTELLLRYPVGASLWHVELTHFSCIDFNWPFNSDCGPLRCTADDPDFVCGSPRDACTRKEPGSVIECSNQVLQEDVAIAGTSHSIHYRSDRVPGRREQRRVVVPISGPELPDSLLAIHVRLEIAGTVTERVFQCPCERNAKTIVEWSGRDAEGRLVNGSPEGVVVLGYEYPLRYGLTQSSSGGGGGGGGGGGTRVATFGRWGDGVLQELLPDHTTALLTRRAKVRPSLWSNAAQGLGGFSLDVVQSYDVTGRTLWRGDGSSRNTESVVNVLELELQHSAPTFDVVPYSDGGQIFSLGTGLTRRYPEGSQAVIGAPVNLPDCQNAGEIPATLSCFSAGLRGLAIGPDGSIYGFAAWRVVRITPDGILHVVAGTGQNGFSGDGGPANLAEIGIAGTVAVAPAADGSVYLGDGGRIRRVDTAGYISTVAGGAATSPQGDGGSAALARFGAISDIALAPDGSLYLLDGAWHLRRIDAGGIVHAVAGYAPGQGIVAGRIDDGQPALDAIFREPRSLTIDREGIVYLVTLVPDPLAGRQLGLIVAITPNGIIRTVAGRGTACTAPGAPACGIGGPALAAKFDTPEGNLQTISIDPDGRILGLAPGYLFKVSPDLPPLGSTGFAVTEPGGRIAYTFDAVGRHLHTFDTETNQVLWAIGYDAHGILDHVTDHDGLVTQIERDADGAPTAIVGPYGHRTLLTLDEDGWLERIEDPSGNAHTATYQHDGLLTSWADPNTDTTTFEWDESGRLTDHYNPAGAHLMLDRTDLDAGMEVTQTSPMGRVTTHRYESIKNAEETKSTLMPNGLTTFSSKNAADISTSTLPDGTVSTTAMGPDPRWGMQSPIPVRSTVSLPSGASLTVEQSRAVTLTDPGDPFTLATRTEATTIDGRTWTTTYDVASRTETTTTPMGRTASSVLDEDGRPIEIHPPDTLPIFLSYDAQGRLETTSQGTRTVTLAYGADGMLSDITDPQAQTSSFARDLNGRVTQHTRPDLEVTGFGYDPDGQTTRVTPPSKPDHILGYNDVELASRYDPPVLATGPTPTFYFYNLDKQVTNVFQAGPRQVHHEYDFAGRLESVAYPGGLVTTGYDAATGQLATLSGPGNEQLAYTYDGPMQTSITWSGDVAGSVAWTRDAAFRLASETVNGAHAVTYAYDNDDLLVQAGDLTLARDAVSGRLTGTTSGIVNEAMTYNDYGEPVSYTAHVDGELALSFDYFRDDLGRIFHDESHGAGARLLEYYYDPAGRLETVLQHGLPIESYEYDPNGNRTAVTTPAGTVEATYDEQDRMLTNGTVAYTWTDNGELEEKFDIATGDTTDFEYDAAGTLRSVTLPDATLIEYTTDALGRRVQKRVDGAFEKAWLWRGGLQPVAELNASGAVVARYVYAGGVNAPALIVRGGATYRLVKDHLGSVRLVVNVATGAIVQALEYDSWGKVLSDSNPGWQPFGYAGGLYDSDTGLVRFGARDYNAETGRWTTRDPIGLSAGVNVYAYAGSDPLNFIDPNGLMVEAHVGRNSVFEFMQDQAEFAYSLGADNWSEGNYVTAGALGMLGAAAELGPTAIEGVLIFGGVKTGGGRAPQRTRAPCPTQPEHGTFYVDPKGNVVPTPPGGSITGSPDARFIQARDSAGNPTGVRIDGAHKAASHPDPRAQAPHAHVPGVTNPDGTPWLPINQ